MLRGTEVKSLRVGRAVLADAHAGEMKGELWIFNLNIPEYTAEVVGVGFRLPVTCAIPLSLAADLIASGVPHVTRSVEHVSAGV